MTKLCECGCGKPTKIATRTRNRNIAGQPTRFLVGHCPGHVHGGPCANERKAAEYHAYTNAQQRCSNPKVRNYVDYGGRGIKFLFTSFGQFIAEIGPRPDGLLLDRINNNGHYEPGNIRWATRSEQNRNRRRWKKPCGSILVPESGCSISNGESNR